MEQKFGKNSILGRAKRPSRADIEALREFCEREGKMVEYRKGEQLVKRFSQDKKSMDLRCLTAEHLPSQARARYTDLHRATPLERYELPLRRCPGIARHLPLNAIASFLRPFGSKRQSRAPLRHSPTVVTHPQGRHVFGEIIPNIHKTPEHLFFTPADTFSVLSGASS